MTKSLLYQTYWICWCQKFIFFGSSKTCYMSTKLHSSLISLYSASWREMNLIDYAWSVEKSYLKNWDWFLDLTDRVKKVSIFCILFHYWAAIEVFITKRKVSEEKMIFILNYISKISSTGKLWVGCLKWWSNGTLIIRIYDCKNVRI